MISMNLLSIKGSSKKRKKPKSEQRKLMQTCKGKNLKDRL